MERYVLDSYAILCYLKHETNSLKVKRILQNADKNRNVIYLNWINLGEIYYIIAKSISKKKAIESINLIKHLPIQLIECTAELILNAAEIKSNYPMSYADSFVVATAKNFGAKAVTGDKEFKSVEKIISVLWI